MRLTPAPRLAADLDCDGLVGGGDLGMLLAAWGEVDAGIADLTGDGVVDAADLALMLASWGGR